MIYIFNNKDTFVDIVFGVKQSLSNSGINCKIINSIHNKRADSKDIYICFGLHDYDGILPKKYIAYQMEQTNQPSSGHSWFTSRYIDILKGAIAVWDYSLKNIQYLKKLGISRFEYVPLGYMPCLDIIPRVPESEKSIDILFYGSQNLRRKKLYNELGGLGIKVEFCWNNLWGDELNKKISQAKIVLNIHFYENPILETSRLSYLISNGAFVISEPSTDPILDKEYGKYLVWAQYDHIVETCLKYLVDKEGRLQIADKGYNQIKEKPYSVPQKLLLDYVSAGEEMDQHELDLETSGINQENSELKYKIAEMETNEEGDSILKLPDIDPNDLPDVSIVTLTYNRSEMLDIAIRNFNRFDYPEDKLQWVIIDDSNERHQELNKKLVGRDIRVKYVQLPKKVSISEKRNIGVNEAKYDIIVHMDDDDYYPPESILARVKLLTKYRKSGVGCVGCTQLGVYNLIENYSYLMDCKMPSEASLAYTRQFWEANPFPSEDVPEGEGIPFLYRRTEQVVIMPYIFNLIAITHNKNITGKLRTLEIDPDEKYTNFFNMWDFNTQLFFIGILKKIKGKP